MSVSIVVPWRSQPAREPMFAYTTRRLLELHPAWPIHLADTKSPTFNRAAARNSGVTRAGDRGDSVVVILDADTIVDETALNEAVSHVEAYGGIVYPWKRYNLLTEEGTEMVLDGARPGDCPHTPVPRSVSAGAIVTTPEAWWEVGGMDERFEGWGHEDTSFLLAARLLLGVEVLDYDVYAGSHPTSDRGGLQARRNRARYQQYKLVRKDPDGMKRLTSDPDRFPVTQPAVGRRGTGPSAVSLPR